MGDGSLVIVGTGIRLVQQCTPESRYQIERADCVYALGGDPAVLHWLETLNPNTSSMHHFYASGRARSETYDLMTETILGGVRAGKKVCAVFYGHPGVFVTPSHAAISRARLEGFEALMLPAISAEDCLFADLCIDPGFIGCQSYEATDFFLRNRKIDLSAFLVLWQIVFVADRSLLEVESDVRRIQLLADVLMEEYPPDHLITVYDAATLPITRPTIQTMALQELAKARVTQQSTLVVPPLTRPTVDPRRVAKLEAALR